MAGKRSRERAQFLTDIIDTATYDSIKYWAYIVDYGTYHPDWNNGENGGETFGYNNGAGAEKYRAKGEPNGYLVLVDVGDCTNAEFEERIADKKNHIRLGLDDIARGLKMTANSDHLSKQIRGWAHDGDVDNDSGSIDSLVADCIIQYAALGDAIYG